MPWRFQQGRSVVIFVCPGPSTWHSIVNRCAQAWRDAGRVGEPPPRPLILSGWAYSSDKAKQERWQSLVRWAEERSLLHLVQLPTPEHGYYVDAITDWIPSDPYDYKHHEPAAIPSRADLAGALSRLVESWTTVAGSLAAASYPLKLTGKKGRRLVVIVTGQAQPPWGGWFKIGAGRQRGEFSAFRKRVNESLAPHQVDHVDFRIRGDGT